MARKKFDSMRQTIVWFLRVAFFLQEKMHTKKFIRVGRRGVEELIGLIHGDIKTDNIILHENECKVIDFGLANHIGEPTGGYEKVPNYTRVSRHIAPELFERMRPAHPSQDAYSLGNLLREMICLTVTVPDDDRIKLTPIIAALCLRAPAERPSVLWLIATLDALYCSHVTRPRVAAAAVVAVEKPTVSLDDEPEVKGVLPKRPIILSDDDEPEVAKQNELACIVEELVISDRPKDDRTHDLPQHPVFAGIRPPVALLRPADTNRVLGLRSNALSQQPRVPSSVSQATTSELMHFFATLNSRVAEGKYTHKENSGLDPFK